MKKPIKKINEKNMKAFISTLQLYVDVLFAEPTQKMQFATVKSKRNK